MNLKDFVSRIPTRKDLLYEISFIGNEEETRILKELCKMRINKRRREEAWGQILYSINEAFYPNNVTTFISEEVLQFLIDNKIDLITLGHLQLSDYWLNKIYEKDNRCIEAKLTILKRQDK